MGRALVAVVLTASLTTGCLGTILESPTTDAPQTYWDLRWHIIAAPTLVEAKACGFGVSKSMTYIPIWGIAIGVFTFGILVPQWTGFSCVTPPK